jgi:hypothetical protein
VRRKLERSIVARFRRSYFRRVPNGATGLPRGLVRIKPFMPHSGQYRPRRQFFRSGRNAMAPQLPFRPGQKWRRRSRARWPTSAT